MLKQQSALNNYFVCINSLKLVLKTQYVADNIETIESCSYIRFPAEDFISRTCIHYKFNKSITSTTPAIDQHSRYKTLYINNKFLVPAF